MPRYWLLRYASYEMRRRDLDGRPEVFDALLWASAHVR
jgi:hypothetical protein